MSGSASEIDLQDRASSSGSGRKAVLLMFGFGLLMVGALWLYWELYTRPFRPLQNAIAAAYPGCRPNVVGGRYKSHLPATPHILRVVVHLPEEEFNPIAEPSLSEQRALELARLADRSIFLGEYDVLEVHLVQQLPEQPVRHWSVARGTGEWKKLLDP